MQVPYVLSSDKDRCHKGSSPTEHIFKVPRHGDYIKYFRIYSNTQVTDKAFRMYQIDTILNYIESVALFINGNLISRISNGKINFYPNYHLDYNVFGRNLVLDEIIPQYDFQFDFLTWPILINCLYDSDIQVRIKFSREPPMKYALEYSLFHIGNPVLTQVMKNTDIRICRAAPR